MFIRRWLTREPQAKEYWRALFGALAICLAYDAISIIAIIHLGVKSVRSPLHFSTLTPWFPFLMLALVALEELTYRYLPVRLACEIYKNTRGFGFWMIIVISSVIFGCIHGSLSAVLFQGVQGFFLSLVFLKFSGMGKKPEKGFVATMIIHFMSNVAKVLLILSLGGRSI